MNEKHTPFKELFGRGLEAQDNTLFADFFVGFGSTRIPSEMVREKIGQVNSVDQAEFIARAASAYERDQETIKALVEALTGLFSAGQFAHGVLAETKFDERKAGEAQEVEDLRVALIRAEEALAQAKERS